MRRADERDERDFGPIAHGCVLRKEETLGYHGTVGLTTKERDDILISRERLVKVTTMNTACPTIKHDRNS